MPRAAAPPPNGDAKEFCVSQESLIREARIELLDKFCHSSRGKSNPRGVKKRASKFPARKRGEPLNARRDLAPEIVDESKRLGGRSLT